MGRGVIRVNTGEALDWFASGNRLEDVKELLLLPEGYNIEGVWCRPSEGSGLHVVVSSPDIPETPGSDIHADVRLEYIQDENDKKRLYLVWINPKLFYVQYDQQLKVPSKEKLEMHSL